MDALPPGDIAGKLRVAQTFGDDSEKRDAIGRVLLSWTATDPARCGSLGRANNRPTPPAVYFYRVASSWSWRDPAGATAWVQSLPDGPEKQKFLENATDVGISIAPQWIALISDPKARDDAYERFAGRWLDRDFVAARDWLNNSTPSGGIEEPDS